MKKNDFFLKVVLTVIALNLTILSFSKFIKRANATEVPIVNYGCNDIDDICDLLDDIEYDVRKIKSTVDDIYYEVY